MPNDLLDPADVAISLDDTVADDSPRLVAAADDGYFAVCMSLRFDPVDVLEGYELGVAQLVAKRAAARFYKNFLDASNVSVTPESSSWSANSLVGPRLLTPDEEKLLNPIRRDVSGTI